MSRLLRYSTVMHDADRRVWTLQSHAPQCQTAHCGVRVENFAGLLFLIKEQSDKIYHEWKDLYKKYKKPNIFYSPAKSMYF